MIFQQGDVILKKIKSIPSGNYEKSLDPIMQHGEHGHFHTLVRKPLAFLHEATAIGEVSCLQWEIFKEKNGMRYLKINEPTDLSHEEHKTIHIPPGEYEINIVKEYDHWAEEARNVID